jgi:hypothetical protein
VLGQSSVRDAEVLSFRELSIAQIRASRGLLLSAPLTYPAATPNKFALRICRELGARTELFNGEFVAGLPLYAPDRATRKMDERSFIDVIRGSHGIIVSTPGYHGSLSGPIKNGKRDLGAA